MKFNTNLKNLMIALEATVEISNSVEVKPNSNNDVRITSKTQGIGVEAIVPSVIENNEQPYGMKHANLIYATLDTLAEQDMNGCVDVEILEDAVKTIIFDTSEETSYNFSFINDLSVKSMDLEKSDVVAEIKIPRSVIINILAVGRKMLSMLHIEHNTERVVFRVTGEAEEMTVEYPNTIYMTDIYTKMNIARYVYDVIKMHELMKKKSDSDNVYICLSPGQITFEFSVGSVWMRWCYDVN